MAIKFCGNNVFFFLISFLKFCQISQQRQNSMDFEGEVSCFDKQQNVRFIPNSANVLLFLTSFDAESDKEEEKLVAETVTDLTGIFRISMALPPVLPAVCRYTLLVSSSCHHLSYHGTMADQRTKPGCRFVYKIKQQKLKELRRSMKNSQINVNGEEVQCNWWRKYLKSKRTQQKQLPKDKNELAKYVESFCPSNDLGRENANEAVVTTASSSAITVINTSPATTTQPITTKSTTQTTTVLPFTVLKVNKSTEKDVPNNENPKDLSCAAVAPSPVVRPSPLDVVLLLDGSGSISSSIFYGQILHFANELAQNLNISAEGTHLAIVQFSNRPKLEFGLSSGNDAQTIKYKIDNISYLDGGTNIGEALLFTLFRVLANGEARANSDRIVVVVTDGVSSDDVVEPADNLRKSANAELIAIGIGENIDQQQLNLITDNSRKVYALKSFDQLEAGLVTRNIEKQQQKCEEKA
ncbi:hypothetical protein niasHT_025055 [Heterodera trifolii]|uniref:VWFA domain-containing protein n=1 Tax=Heterodera trifolii TaxID=157864 RepID=A0ABD2KKR6_9BILA